MRKRLLSLLLLSICGSMLFAQEPLDIDDVEQVPLGDFTYQWRNIYARTPMQWSGDENGGFTTGEPWFAVNPNYTRINAKEALEDENSVFYYYQKLIRLRKENPVFVNGKFELLLPEDERIFAYTRTDEHTKMLVCTNFTDEEVSCPLLDEWKAGEVWIRNYEDDREGNILRPYEAVIIAFTGK